MKTTQIILIGLFLTMQLRAQDDTLTHSHPIIYSASYTGDFVNNLFGGIKRGSAYLGMANLSVGFDTEKAKMWNGGELYVNLANTHGFKPSVKLIGDFQIASNIEAGNLTYLHELWYKHTFRKIVLITGLQDLCNEFLSSENAALFLNSSFGVPSNIANNIPISIFPLTSIGVQAHLNVSKNFIIKFALFDGMPTDWFDNPHNIAWHLSKKDGFITFSEISYNNLLLESDGTYKLGYCFHNKEFVNTIPENNKYIENAPSNYSFYFVADQTIINFKNSKKLSFFFQGSMSPKLINENYYYTGMGLNFKGLMSKRPNEIMGLGIAHAGFENAIVNETVIELTYMFEMNRNIYIQPDIQYIINPAATASKLKNAILANIRLGMSF